MIDFLKRKKTGVEGEEFACNYLRKTGYQIIDRNVNYKFGEIDIVAKRDDVLYFFEIRTKKSNFATPLESITPAKIKRVKMATNAYLTKSKWNGPCEIGYIGINMFYNPPQIECVFDEG